MGRSTGSTANRAVLLGAAAAGLAALLLFLWWRSRPPQMGPDHEVSRTVDALFTAITARDEEQLTACERRLHTLKDAGKLPTEACAHLDTITSQARAGRWESAARSLY